MGADDGIGLTIVEAMVNEEVAVTTGEDLIMNGV